MADPEMISEVQAAFERGYAADRAWRDAYAATPGVGIDVSALAAMPGRGLGNAESPDPRQRQHISVQPGPSMIPPQPVYADMVAATYGQLPMPPPAAADSAMTVTDAIVNATLGSTETPRAGIPMMVPARRSLLGWLLGRGRR